MDKNHFKHRLNELIFQVARSLEILFSVVILLVIAVSIVPLLGELLYPM